MFSLQIQIKNLTPTHFSKSVVEEGHKITIRFGPLQAQMVLDGQLGTGGKRLILEMEIDEMKDLLATYAFGIFMQNQRGRYWCLLSLEKVHIGEQINNDGVRMFDDYRNVCYEFNLIIKMDYHQPKVPQKFSATQPDFYPSNQKQNNINKNGATTKPKVNSFLYGKNKQSQNNLPMQLKKNPIPPRKHTEKKIKYGVADTQPLPKQTYNNYIEDDSMDNPPMMEFTNDQNQNNIQLPTFEKQGPIMSNFQNIGLEKQKFKTFSNFQDFKNRKGSIEKNKKQIIEEKAKKRQQLREQARRDAQQAFKKKKDTQIMIPVPNEISNTYNLVPISELTQAQIIQYAQKQQMADQYKRHLQMERKQQAEKDERRRKKREKLLQVKQNQLRNMKKGLEKQKIGGHKVSKANQRISQEDLEDSDSDSMSNQKQKMNKKQSKKSGQGYTQFVEEKDPPYDSEAEPLEQSLDQEDEYADDFESVSNAGSLMKSRFSLRQSTKKKDQKDMNQSLDQYGYSQDFDSFSQSRMSRNKRANSISEISDSMISVSYRK